MRHSLYVLVSALLLFAPLQAGTYTYETETGTSINGSPVSITLTFTTSPGLLQLTVTNDETNPIADNQAVSQVFFDLNNAGLIDLFGSYSSTPAIKISRGGDWSVNSGSNSNPECDTLNVTSCKWAFTASGGAGVTTFEMNVLSGKQPNQLLIGDPNPATGTYSAANGSIENSHNPWLQHSMTWSFTSSDPATRAFLGNVNSSDISLLALNFSTTACSGCQTGITTTSTTAFTLDSPSTPTQDSPALDSPTQDSPTPEPDTVALFVSGVALMGIGGVLRRRKARE